MCFTTYREKYVLEKLCCISLMARHNFAMLVTCQLCDCKNCVSLPILSDAIFTILIFLCSISHHTTRLARCNFAQPCNFSYFLRILIYKSSHSFIITTSIVKYQKNCLVRMIFELIGLFHNFLKSLLKPTNINRLKVKLLKTNTNYTKKYAVTSFH